MGLLLPFLFPQSAATWSLFLEEKRKTPASAGTQDTQWAMFGSSSISKRKWKSRTFLPAAVEKTVSGVYDEDFTGIEREIYGISQLQGHTRAVIGGYSHKFPQFPEDLFTDGMPFSGESKAVNIAFIW